MPISSIEPVLFGDPPLHGIYCPAVGEPRASALIVSPLFEEKRCAHRALITCARALAGAGIAVLLPDLYATGNSAGTPMEINLDRWMCDLHTAVRWLRERAEVPPVILACRAGALLAAQAVADGLPAARLILWQPVLSGRGYLGQLHTRRMVQEKMTGEEPVEVGKYEVEGMELSPELYASLESLRLPSTPPTPDTRLLQCSFSEKLLTEYERLVSQWGADQVRARCVIAEPFWNPHTPGAYAALTTALTEEVLS